MRKFLFALTLSISTGLFAYVPAYAADTPVNVDENEDADDYTDDFIVDTTDTTTDIEATTNVYENNMKYLLNERTDTNMLYEYTLLEDYVYYYGPNDSYSMEYPTYLETTAKSIVAGITSDYEKVKAINKWVAENLWYALPTPVGTITSSYNYFTPNTPFRESLDLVAGDATVCGGYAELAVNLLRAAGFPAKEITGDSNGDGSWDGHAWVEVWVDNRWLFMDPTWDTANYLSNGKFTPQAPCRSINFDMSVESYSLTHKIDVAYMMLEEWEHAWDGIVTIRTSEGHLLKEINTLNAGDLLPATLGYDAKDMYHDFHCTRQWNLATDRVSRRNSLLIVKSPPITITYDSRGGTTISPITIERNYVAEDITEGVQIVRPANPTRNGYTFVGWSNVKPLRDLKSSEEGNDFGPTYAKNDKLIYYLVDFEEDRFNDSATIYAVWQAKPVTKYKVTYDTNGGSTIKSVTVSANTTITKPTATTRKGYKFAGWYKNSKCTVKWNFSSDKVSAKMTLYAKWKKL